MAEEFTHFRKSKPVILAATIIWVVIAYVASQDPSFPKNGLKHSLDMLF